MHLEGMEEASIFVHVAVNDITGKVGTEREVQELLLVVGLVRKANGGFVQEPLS